MSRRGNDIGRSDRSTSFYLDDEQRRVAQWAFVAPAIAPAERRAVRPLLILVPALFGAGTAFGYFVVLPPAVGVAAGRAGECSAPATATSP
jgi:Sec-independent protein secretion pathway component TatC